MTFHLQKKTLEEQCLYWEGNAMLFLAKKYQAKSLLYNLVLACEKAEIWQEGTHVWNALHDAKEWLEANTADTDDRLKTTLFVCSACDGTGIMPGDPTAPAESILRVDMPCLECQDP